MDVRKIERCTNLERIPDLIIYIRFNQAYTDSGETLGEAAVDLPSTPGAGTGVPGFASAPYIPSTNEQP